MHIITVMNYRKTNEIIMCKAWIYFAKRFNPKASITIFYRDLMPDIVQFASKYTNVQFIRLSKHDMHADLTRGFVDHPVQEFQLAVWKQIEKHRIHKFIYTDADAFILGSLDTWWKCMDNKPYIAVNEQVAPYTPVLNSGIHSYNSKSGFVTYKKLLSQYKSDGNRILIFAGEQGLINGYFRRIGYDYTHPSIDFTYNCLAKWCRIRSVSDTSIIIMSGRFPWIKKMRKIIRGRDLEWWERWSWWNKEKQAIILHAFGRKGFKFWELPECRPLWEYCKTIAKKG